MGVTKLIVSVLVFIGVFAFILFVIDPAIVAWIVKTANPSKDWIGTIKLICWGVILFYGIGISFIIALLASLIPAFLMK